MRTSLALALFLTLSKILSTPNGFFHLSNLETCVISGLSSFMDSFEIIFLAWLSEISLFLSDNGSIEGATKNWSMPKSRFLYLAKENIAPSYCFAKGLKKDHAFLFACSISIWHLQIHGCLFFFMNFINPRGCGSCINARS